MCSRGLTVQVKRQPIRSSAISWMVVPVRSSRVSPSAVSVSAKIGADFSVQAHTPANIFRPACSPFMGHASITETYDRYGHLFPGAADEVRELQERYLESVVQAVVQEA
jgi:hypothetical protein